MIVSDKMFICWRMIEFLPTPNSRLRMVCIALEVDVSMFQFSTDCVRFLTPWLCFHLLPSATFVVNMSVTKTGRNVCLRLIGPIGQWDQESLGNGTHPPFVPLKQPVHRRYLSRIVVKTCSCLVHFFLSCEKMTFLGKMQKLSAQTSMDARNAHACSMDQHCIPAT